MTSLSAGQQLHGSVSTGKEAVHDTVVKGQLLSTKLRTDPAALYYMLAPPGEYEQHINRCCLARFFFSSSSGSVSTSVVRCARYDTMCASPCTGQTDRQTDRHRTVPLYAEMFGYERVQRKTLQLKCRYSTYYMIQYDDLVLCALDS